MTVRLKASQVEKRRLASGTCSKDWNPWPNRNLSPWKKRHFDCTSECLPTHQTMPAPWAVKGKGRHFGWGVVGINYPSARSAKREFRMRRLNRGKWTGRRASRLITLSMETDSWRGELMAWVSCGVFNGLLTRSGLSVAGCWRCVLKCH